MSWTFIQSFSFIPLMASEKKSFEYLFRKFTLYVVMATNQISDLDKIHMNRRGLLEKNFCKTFVKISAMRQH